MKTQALLTLDDTRAIAAAAESEATKNGWAVTIAIVDGGDGAGVVQGQQGLGLHAQCGGWVGWPPLCRPA